MRTAAAVLVLGLLAMPLTALAEGSGHANSSGEEAVAKPKPVRRAKPKPKTPPPTLPDAPVPYHSLNGTPLSPDMAQALTPSAPNAHPEVHPVAVAPEAHPVTTVPPPPPPPIEAIAPPPPAPAPTTINLKCETRITQGAKTISSGSFYIEITPSPVFPDQTASFQFRFVDPAHASLIRDTICLDTACSAQVTPSAYALVNRVDKKGDALRITLDRTRGGFYAESVRDGLIGSAHLGEQGWCTPQAAPTATLF